MFKKSLIALSALVMLAGAAPALAATSEVFGSTDSTQLDLAKAAVAHELQHRGINVSNIDEWGGYVRADVTLANGTQAVQFFVPNSLTPVAVNDLR